MKKHILFFSLTLIVLGACEEQGDPENTREIFIDNLDLKETADISHLIDSINIFPLTETKGNHIGEISKLYKSRENYIIFDRVQAKKINLYDENGVFLKPITKPGKGPNEVLQVNDCWLNSKGELEVYDYAQNKIYQYDTSFILKDKKSLNVPFIYHSLMRYPNSENYVGYTTFDTYNPKVDGNNFQLALMDKNLDVLFTSLHYDESFIGIEWRSLKQHFLPYKNSLRFIQALDNYIYDVTETSLKKKYKLAYSENPLPDNLLAGIVGDNLNLFKDREVSPREKFSYFKDFAQPTGIFLENEHYYYVVSREGDKFPFYSLINKQDLNVEFNAKHLIESSRYHLKLPPFEFFDEESNSFIAVMPGLYLKDFLYQDSKFQNVVNDELGTIYIVSVKFKK